MSPEKYEAPTLTRLNHPTEMKTVELLRRSAELLEPFAWGRPLADELRVRAARMEGGRAAEVMGLYVDPVRP